MIKLRKIVAAVVFANVVSLIHPAAVRAEVILQYFNTTYNEIADKMPELAEVGYGALWLPPPTKASGSSSTGYDLYDPFDLGGRDQHGFIETRYGSEAELIRLIEVAHRFGIRVYFDNIMNHRGFDVPGYDENTPIDIYPGMVPEDFHLRVTEDGFYRKWDNISDWNDAWQVQNRNFSDLIDVSQETPNANFGTTEGDTFPKVRFVRHPNNPEFYDYHPTLGRVGFANSNITVGLIASNQDFYSEDVWLYLMRSVRWIMDHTKVDGLRLDAVKHVPSYFFGDQDPATKDASNAGYTGQAQEQFDITHGYSDTSAKRDSVFNTDIPRDDAMIFGEHLGEPPSFSEYIAAGMRLVDSQLKGSLNNLLGNPSASLAGLDTPGYSGSSEFNQYTGVMFVKSHDDDYAIRPELQYAYYLTRQGLPNIYTDGNHQSETLAQSGGAFPRHANTAFLGQFNDNRIPNLVYIHDQFGRAAQVAKWSDADVVAYERQDKRENNCMNDADGTILAFMMNDNYSSGQYREIPTTFPVGAYLWQYSTGGGNFYYTVPADGKIKVIVPSGGYFAFSWRNPEESDLWKNGGGKPVTIYQSGQLVTDVVNVVRKDGPDGDPAFNPYGVPDSNTTDYAYTYPLPRVTSPTNLRFVARVDGSAANVLLKLDGGIDLNYPITNALGDPRDNPPALSYDMFLGYEQAVFNHREFKEKFAAQDSNRDQIGSAGAETYQCTIGSAGFSINQGPTNNDFVRGDTASWVFHDPQASVTGGTNTGPQFVPAPESAAGSNVAVWVKVGYACDLSRMFFYYTVDGQTYPEGAGGEGIGATKTVELLFHHNDAFDDTGTPDWWTGTLPAFTNGTILRYKIGGYKQEGYGCATNDWTIAFPSDATAVARKLTMLGEWEVTNFNASTIVYKPHNDYSPTVTATGLVEGMHVLRARAFLQRDGAGCGNDKRASIFNTFVQSFYYDISAPTGRIYYPQNDGDGLGSQEYGVVIRSDPTVTKVWFHIDDSDPANDDGQTGQLNGNGTNAAGQASWSLANSEVASLDIASPYPQQWRFSYVNIPASGVSTISVKLAELSSSTNPLDSAATGHFGLLTRLANAMAPTQQLFVAYPQNDGDLINDQWDYVMKAWFSKSMDSSVTNFLIRIDGSAQAQSAYSIHYDVDSSHHELAFTLPDLYSGDTNALHHIEVVYTSNGGVSYQANRYIRAFSQVSGPYVSIVSPPEVDGDGQPFKIVLPDVASPTSTQRQYAIQVDTDLSASNVWIEFANASGSAGLVAAVETPIGGLVSVASGSTSVTGSEKTLTGTVTALETNATVTGTGTAFTNELLAGSTIRISTNTMIVTQLVSATSLAIDQPYPGPSVTNVAAFQRPVFNSDLQIGNSIRISNNYLSVAQVLSGSNIVLGSAYPASTLSGAQAYRVDPNPTTDGNRKHWTFLWTNMSKGYFTFYARVDTNGVTNTVEASATRNITVVFREIVTSNTNDLDDDDDGLYDYNELTATNLPSGDPENWVNDQVHIYYVYGKTDPLSPDSDGDGLPDGLESGWRSPIDTSQTDTNADLNGDGFKNFISDLDPPFFNTLDNHTDGGSACTVPGVKSRNEGGDRSQLIKGSMTDPNNPDSDYDGIPDGVEDANRNGWVDGDGDPLLPTQDKCSRTNWPNHVIDVGEHWTETDPNVYDSDTDGAGDGTEDANHNGHIDGDTNSNRVWDAGEQWTETNPLNPDTDGDGLPDGWELQYGFDPLDDGVIGHTSMRTGLVITNTDNGANGNPDGDFLCNTTNVYVNLLEYQNGDNPRVTDTCLPPPDGSIVIGRGTNVLGVINGVTNYTEFTDWTWDDLMVLDEYEGDGLNNQGGDEYLAYDGWDTSRDIVAFYARDGGPTNNEFYFRVDFHDLQAKAEEGNLDIYVVIDTGNPAAGEMALPDEVDLITSCRWEVVVAAYQSGQGAVYVDTNPGLNSTTESDGTHLTDFGVQRRDQNSANGFKASYYNSDLDAVEFSISRQALLDAGWNGDANSLNYQVFDTKDGTCNSCVDGQPGAGDIAGRNDVRDTIYDDQVAEDYWQNQPSIQNALVNYFNRSTFAGRAKVAMVVHGNQAIQPGSVIQNLINTGNGAGYERLFDIHDVYKQPVNLHVTPTLASAMQWASVDTNASPTWRDGPLFNARIRQLMETNVVHMLGSTFSDHLLPYFTSEYNQDNSALAKEFLNDIYGATIDTNSVFWTPERVLDADTFSKIQDMGYQYTLVDQDTHLFTWLGRTTSLGDGGYQINRINGVDCFVINNDASNYRFQNNDNGLNMPLRGLFNRKARSGSQDQVVTILSNWEDFDSNTQADAYDKNIRWIANHPWVQLVALDDITRQKVDLTRDGTGDTWYVVDRGNAATNKLSHNQIQHSSEGNIDNWYIGLTNAEESLQQKYFEIRPGTNVSRPYGMMYFPGLLTDTWSQITSVGDTNLAKLGRGAMHASGFETSFHNEDITDLTRFSIGTYVTPDTTYDTLASFSKQAQAQARVSAIYKRVDSWAFAAGSITNVQTETGDYDLDGENEYALFNDRLFAIFERIGGRMIGAWVRDILSGRVYQALGNQVGFAGSENEQEGAYNVDTNAAGAVIVAYRTSGLKDWFINGSIAYNNDLYTVANWTNGWRLTSGDGNLSKTITLAPKSWQFEVNYQLSGALSNQALYVRDGLSPDLYDLLLHGQRTLDAGVVTGGVFRLSNTNYEETVVDSLGYSDAGHNAGINAGAVDDDPSKGVTFYTVNMRNQAQTHQVELVGTNNFSFSVGFHAALSDWDGDGMPNTYEAQYGLNPSNSADGAQDSDGDHVSNANEYIAGTSPNDSQDFLHATQTIITNSSGVVVKFPTKAERDYYIWYMDGDLVAPSWVLATTNPISGTGGTVSWTDDGTLTAPPPAQATNRYYKIQVALPQ